MKKLIISLIAFGIILSPTLALAQFDTTIDKDKAPPFDSGITYSFNDAIDSANSIINIILWVIVIVVFIFFLYSAFLYATSGGDPEKAKTAKNQLIYSLIAIAILVFAGFIWSFVASIFTDTAGSGGSIYYSSLVSISLT